MPDQFATYHFRRKYVSGSYVSFDPTECNENNDVSDNVSENDTTITLMSDNGILLSLTEICSTDGYSNDIFNSNMSSEALIDDGIKAIIKEH